MFKSIDPNALQSRGEPRKVSPRSGVGNTFSVLSGSLAPVAGASLSVSGRQQSAAVTSAALTGVAGAARPQGYLNDFTVQSPFPPSGIGGGVPTPIYPSGASGTVAAGAGAAAGVGGTGGPMTFEQQSTLISMMQDSQMQMLMLQSQVQDVAREYSTYSNILKSKHDTEMNAVRNIRVS